MQFCRKGRGYPFRVPLSLGVTALEGGGLALAPVSGLVLLLYFPVVGGARGYDPLQIRCIGCAVQLLLAALIYYILKVLIPGEKKAGGFLPAARGFRNLPGEGNVL